ncbi:MAG: DNA repair protein RecN [Blastochloris sp.]|nr:DNA repair protein RecN [Blastochloris sp.]
MLRSLRIKNLALIEDLTWDLHEGLNILSGETGAGKSILIDAFNLLLGGRAEQALIRDGATECLVEGLLDASDDLDALLVEAGMEPCQDGELLLKRSFTTQKQNRQFINGSPATLQVLKKIGDILVDMHGPHDHQSLLSIDHQLGALDAYGGLGELVSLYQEQQKKTQSIEQEIQQLESFDQRNLQEELDFLDHQLQEIESAKLSPEEESSAQQNFQIASNAQKLIELGNTVTGILSESEESVMSQLARVQRQLREWQQIDNSTEELVSQNESVISQVQELVRDVQDRVERIDLDSSLLKSLEERLDLIHTLKRKYGSTIEAVLAKGLELQAKRESLAGREEKLIKLKVDLKLATAQRKKHGDELTESRKKFSPKLSKEVSSQLKELGFKQSEFTVQLENLEAAGSRGFNRVEFQFAPNPGESARALRSIASSGEMARVMLALKSVLAEKDKIPVLIFDEVDANVGGETALAVGKRLRQLAKKHQVLCITHLPQVAAAGHVHFRVEKKLLKGRTLTLLENLERKERVSEMARMLGDSGSTAKELANSLLAQFD